MDVLRAYLQFADAYFSATGFRCNMPLGAYHIRTDSSSLLSYTYEFAFEHGGTPLLNQSPFVERKHVEAAYGQSWLEFSNWVRSVDPTGRMLNPFFADSL